MPNDQIHRFFLLTVLLALFASLPLCAQNTFSGNPVRYKSACAEQMERFYALTVECLLDYDAQLEQNIKETYLTTDHVLHPDFYGKRSKNALFSYENYVAELKKNYANHLEEDEEFDVQVHDLGVRGASHPAENSEALYVEVEYTTQVLSGSRSLYRGKTQAVLYFPSLYNTLECTIKQIIPADEWTVADNKQPTVKNSQGKAKSQELSPAELLKLGDDYYYGRNGKEKSYEKAVEYYFQAAELGDAEAQYNLGYAYEYEEGLPQSYEKAVEWYKKSAAQGFAKGQRNLGGCYFDGNGVRKNEKEGVKWIRKAADQGDAKAQYTLGILYYDGLGGLPQSYEKAVDLWMKSAEQGYAYAQYNLGVCYANGRGGLPQSYEKAAEWYMKSAEKGDASAQYNLGAFYAKGLGGLPQSHEKAVEWYMKSAEQGNAYAQCNLGAYYANGQGGLPQSYEKAVEWYMKSAEQGNASAQCHLGVCYANGQGVPQSYEKAVEWYMKSVEQGDASAQCNLGVCYANGQSVPQSYEKAVEWWMRSAEQGYAYAQYNLGVCYKEGRGVSKSVSKALEWYRKADANGHPEAKIRIAELEKTVQTTSVTTNEQSVSLSDTFILHGTVVDKRDGLPVIGCTVGRREKLTSKKFISGAVTDVNGKFSLEVKTGDVLIFSYMGMETCSYVIPTQDKVKSGIKVVMKGDK